MESRLFVAARYLTVVPFCTLLACSTNDLPSAPNDGGADGGGLADLGGRDGGIDAAVDGSNPTDLGAADGARPDLGGVDAGSADYHTAVRLGDLGEGLDEISGIVASRTYPGTFWVHNDSGDTPRFFAINETAATVATINVADATSRDWEDITITSGTGGDVLYLANTGDNEARETNGDSGREFIELYRVEEPNPADGDATVEADRYELEYPERPYDCESVFVDHASGDIYLVTKQSAPVPVFVARAPLSTSSRNTLENVGTMPLDIATAADESRDGRRIAVRGYVSILVYDHPEGTSVIDALNSAPTMVAPASAAEAVCFEPTSYGLYTVAEGAGSPLYHIPWE